MPRFDGSAVFESAELKLEEPEFDWASLGMDADMLIVEQVLKSD